MRFCSAKFLSFPLLNRNWAACLRQGLGRRPTTPPSRRHRLSTPWSPLRSLRIQCPLTLCLRSGGAVQSSVALLWGAVSMLAESPRWALVRRPTTLRRLKMLRPSQEGTVLSARAALIDFCLSTLISFPDMLAPRPASLNRLRLA